MRIKEYLADGVGINTFGLLGEILIALVGAFFGVFYGESMLATVGRGSSTSIIGTLVLTAALGAVIFLFIANILRVISGPSK